MKEVTAKEFKAKCLRILDELDEEGLVITKRGKAVAQVVRIRPDPRDYIWGAPGLIVDRDWDGESAGIVWEAESPVDVEARQRFIEERRVSTNRPRRGE